MQQIQDKLNSFKYFKDICISFEQQITPLPMPSFAPAVDALEQFYTSDTDLFVIQSAPRFGKSLTFVIAYSLYMCNKYKNFRIAIVAGVGENLIKTFSKSIRKIVSSPEFCDIYPNLRPQTDNVNNWIFSNNSEIQFFSVRGNIIGLGFHLILVDDFYMKVESYKSAAERESVNSYFDSALKTRATDYILPDDTILKAKFLVTSAPWGVLDHVHKLKDLFPNHIEYKIPCMYKNDAGEWVSNHYSRPVEFFLKEKESQFKSKGSHTWFENHFMCNDQITEAEEFILDHDVLWFNKAIMTGKEKYYMAIDFSEGRSATSDFTAAIVFYMDSTDCIYVVDGFEIRKEIHESKKDIGMMCKKWNIKYIFAERDYMTTATKRANFEPYVTIVKKYSKDVLRHTIEFAKLTPQREVSAKIDSLAGFVNSGRFKLLEDNHFCKDTLFTQLYAYPNVAHDDCVMACTVIALNSDSISKLSVKGNHAPETPRQAIMDAIARKDAASRSEESITFDNSREEFQPFS